ncbi:hypothetical protein HEP86_00030 [Streptomyces sp. RPA4-5]|nr:hypothetical protein [Streptomyces sp. RPA4-5]QIY53196.1 hypothetical protein HEP86_00030 [Streptomyces sp. RPA4-5]
MGEYPEGIGHQDAAHGAQPPYELQPSSLSLHHVWARRQINERDTLVA